MKSSKQWEGDYIGDTLSKFLKGHLSSKVYVTVRESITILIEKAIKQAVAENEKKWTDRLEAESNIIESMSYEHPGDYYQGKIDLLKVLMGDR